MRLNVCREFRPITIMTGFLQAKPSVAHPMVMVFNASQALTVLVPLPVSRIWLADEAESHTAFLRR
jgi:hypothetical protein